MNTEFFRRKKVSGNPGEPDKSTVVKGDKPSEHHSYYSPELKLFSVLFTFAQGFQTFIAYTDSWTQQKWNDMQEFDVLRLISFVLAAMFTTMLSLMQRVKYGLPDSLVDGSGSQTSITTKLSASGETTQHINQTTKEDKNEKTP